MKKIRRLFAVVFLFSFLALVGYLSYSGSRFFQNGNLEEHKGIMYYATEADVFLSIDEEMATVYRVEGEEYYLDLESYEDFILQFTDGVNTYRFLLLGEEAVYDVQRKLILYATY